MEKKLGLYIYCIIPSSQERNFGPVGIDGEDVLTIGYENLAMVVSSHPISKLVVSKDNMLIHEKVIEEVMKEYDSVLPVRYGTIASSADEVRNLLDRRYREFKNYLRDMDHMVELGVKGVWKDMAVIFKEIEKENIKIKKAKEKIKNSDKSEAAQEARVEIGRMVEAGLYKKKEQEAQKITEVLSQSSYDMKLNKTSGDSMFMNASFLVGKGREFEFDNLIDELSEKYDDRIRFMYSGPFPVYNFVNIAIYPEEWEK